MGKSAWIESPDVRSTRTHETSVWIAAPVEEVWRALTEPAEMERWFAPSITVEPGPGGFVLADWAPGLAWRTSIEIWDSGSQLRLAETRDRVMTSAPVDLPLTPCVLVQDYTLEAGDGGTRLRLLHSGFGASPDWDSEYYGTLGGWASCFLRLKHGLERRRGESVRNIILTAQCPGVSISRALEMLEAEIPRPFRMQLCAHSHIHGYWPEWNDSCLTLSVQATTTGAVAYVEMLLYSLPAGTAEQIQENWRAALARLFPTPS
jgi:uncharacterized protein YndB with AHSA1/START domain